MKQTETAQLLAVIKTAFPNFQVTEQSIRLWHDFLKEVPFEQAQRNLKEHIQTSHFPPAIADIVRHDPTSEQVNQLQQETQDRFLLMARWEQAATSMPLHLRRGAEDEL